MKTTRKPYCWCYTAEINVCGDCDREYIQIDIRTYRKLNPKIREIIDSVKKKERKELRTDDSCDGEYII